MNPFERFQEMRSEILQNESFMDNLRTYAFNDRLRLIENKKVTPLGGGYYNIHFRIGKVRDIWLATREYTQAIDPDQYLYHSENYIARAVRAYEEGKRVPAVCGGVRVTADEDSKHFLLLEDLTAGGAADFKPAPRSGGISGTVNGIEVFHDFDTDSPSEPEILYMAEDKIILL